jgi:fatty-acyl-CoA synthase
VDFNLAQVQEALGERLGEREAIVTARGRFSWAELTERTRRLANVLVASGLGVAADRSQLADYEAGQDRVAICLLNGHEYLEAIIGSFKARCAPCNVNYRYVTSELEELLTDMAPRAVIFQSQFAPQIGAALERLADHGLVEPPALLLEVPDGSGVGFLAGALDYETALAAAPADRPQLDWSPDDLYILYTGGTTGKPKGVLWRQGDIFVTALGGRNFKAGREWTSLAELVSAAGDREGTRGLSAAPFMHGTGQWVSFQALHTGGTVVIPGVVDRYDAGDVLDTVERERVNLLTIAGEAFAAPLIDAMDARRRDLSSLVVVSSSGAALSPKSKEAILARLPGVRIRDTMGSSEAGPLADTVNAGGGGVAAGGGGGAPVRFNPDPLTRVLDEDKSEVLDAGHEATGWIARSGRIPLGYLNDAVKTAATFRTIGGVRYTIPGDRALLHTDGTIEVLGRDAVTINSGGEKIFAEEVEAAIRHHPGVRDVMVVGRPSERWGSEVVALVEPEPGAGVDRAELLTTCATYIARYKLPKAVVIVDRVMRNPAGKADYRWARSVAEASGSTDR